MLKSKKSIFSLLFSGLIIVLCSPVAQSQSSSVNQPSNSKKKRIAPAFEMRSKKQSIPQLPPQIERQQKRAKAVQPPKAARSFSGLSAAERRLEKSLDDEIRELHRLIKKYKKTSKRGDLYLRQAELFREKSRIVSFRLQEAHDVKLDRWERSGRHGKKPVLRIGRAQEYNEKAIELYRWFIEDFPKDPRAAMAHYFLGYNYFEAGALDAGKKSFLHVAKNYPQSKYANLARFQLAEHLFEERQWRRAQELYAEVIKDRKGENYLFAYYKYSWCFFHLKQVGKALREMTKVYQGTLRQAKRERRKFSRRLVTESRKGLVFFYAETANYEQAYNYFRSLVSEKEVIELLSGLAGLHAERGETRAAAFLYRQVLSSFPMTSKAPFYAYEIIVQVNGLQNPKEYHQKLIKWIKSYNRSSRWGRANPSSLAEAQKFQEEKLRVWTLHNHRSVQFGTKGFSRERTLAAYQNYLKHFAETENGHEMRFFYADLLYNLKYHRQASNQYLHLVKNDPESARLKDYYFGALLSLEKELPPDEAVDRGVGKSLQPIRFSPQIRQFVNLANIYLEKFPRERASLEIQYRVSRLEYLHNHFDEAKRGFRQIVRSFPDSELAEYSANLLLDIYNLQEDYQGFVRVGREIARIAPLRQTQLGKDINGMVEKAAFKAMTSSAESVKSYLEFIRQYPKSSLIGSAYFNAAVLQQKQDRPLESIVHYKKAMEKQKDGRFHRPARQALAKLYEKTGQYELAAGEYEKLALLLGFKDSEGGDFLYNSAVLWSSLGQSQRAEKGFDLLLKHQPKRRRQVLGLLAEHYHELNQWKKSNTYYQSLMAEFPKDESHCQWSRSVAENERKRNRTQVADKMLKKTEQCLARAKNSSTARVQAELRFNQAVDVYSQLIKSFRGRSPAEREKALGDKIKLLDGLDQQLKKVVALNVNDYIVSSLAVAGEAYRYVARFIQASPDPKGLTTEELAAYRTEVDKYVEQMKSNSEDYSRLSLQKAEELKWTTPWLESVAASRSLFKERKVQLGVKNDF